MVHSANRVVATALVLALSLTAGSAATGAGAVRGVVLGADGTTPRPGVAVRLASPGGEPSPPITTDDRGRFAIEAAAPGTYALLVETAGATWLAGSPVVVSAERATSVAVRLAPAQSGGTTTPATAAKELPDWAEWLIAGGIVVIGTLLILEATDQEETSASPF